MARKSRVHFRNALDHVIARGNGGISIFLVEQDLWLCHAAGPTYPDSETGLKRIFSTSYLGV